MNKTAEAEVVLTIRPKYVKFNGHLMLPYLDSNINNNSHTTYLRQPL